METTKTARKSTNLEPSHRLSEVQHKPLESIDSNLKHIGIVPIYRRFHRKG